MRPSSLCLFCLLCLLWLGAALPAAITLNPSVAVNGNTCDQVGWTDAAGRARTASIVQLNGAATAGVVGGFISQVTYNDGVGAVTCNESGNSVDGKLSGLGQMVNHGGTGNGWVSSNEDGIKAGASTQVLFQGANHVIYQVDMDEYGDNGNHAKGTWHDRWIYMFATGQDHIVESLSYDFSSQIAGYWGYVGINSQTGHDSRSPYCSFNWTGTGSANTLSESIDGIEWAARDATTNSYIFKTVGSSPFSSGYTYNTAAANIPYTLQWKNAPDREIGYISTLDLTQWAAGGGFTSQCLIGSSSPSMPANWGVNYQANGFQGWMGDKMTWGVPYGAAGGATGGATFPDWTYARNWTGYPTMGYTLLIQLGKHSDDKVRARVAEQAAIHALPATALTAAVGTVVTAGKMNLQDPTSTFAFKPQGYNHIYHAWQVTCAGSAADITLALGAASLGNPTFFFDNFTAGSWCSLTLNGVAQAEGTDVFTSLDATGHRLYVTFNKAFSGSEHIVLGSSCGTATLTPTFSRTPTITLTPTLGAPTFTPSASPTLVAGGSGKQYCLTLDYSAVPTLLNYRKITLNVNVGTCASVTATEDGSAIPASYNAATGIATLTASSALASSSIVVTAVGWTSGGSGAATKGTLYNNYHWAWSQTFDDGYASAWVNGGAVLAAHSFEGGAWRAGEAYVGSFVGANWGPDACLGTELLMSSAQWTAARAAGWDIYNHTWDHASLTCANFQTEFDQNQTAALAQFPGYFLNHVVYPYETDTPVTSACAGWPRSYLRTGEQNNNSYNYVDVPIPSGFTGTPAGNMMAADRSGDTFMTTVAAWEAIADAAATNARPTWLINISHRVYPGSCIGNDTQYSTNVTNFSAYCTYLDSKYGSGGGNGSMWVAPSGEVADYLLVRDSVVVNAFACGTPTPTQTPCPACTATATVTSSPSVTASPTTTPLPACSGNVIDNLDASGANNFGGFWYVYTTAPSTITPASFALSSPGVGGTGSCARINGNFVAGAYLGMGTGLASTGSNLTAYAGFSFWAKGDGGTYRFAIHSLVEGAATNDYKFDFTAPAAWTLITIPWASFSWPGYGTNYPLDKLQISGIGWAPLNPGAYDLSVDSVALLCPVPTATVTPTTGAGTATPTRTLTSSATVSASPTASPSVTGTRSATPSLTSSGSPTASSTVTATSSATPSATPSSSATATPTPSVSRTTTPSPSASPTISPTFTAVPPGSTLTITPTDSPSSTGTPTDTPTASATDSPTASASPTDTPTLTGSPTSTATGTPSPSPSRTLTLTPLPTVSPTATPSPANTAAPSPTSSVTGTPSLTVTATLSRTAMPSMTGTPSLTRTSTTTPTQLAAAPTATATPSATLVAASTAGIDGSLEILDLQAVPNPNPGSVALQLSGPADEVQVDVYSVAETKVASRVSGACNAGWSRVPLPLGWAESLPSGVYYLRAVARQGSRRSAAFHPIKLVLLR